jgi:CPA2 family monovalent cation:H+ antiporter-2
VIVRSHDDTDLDRLQAGAAEVVPELMEGSLMLASHALVMLGVPLRRVVHRVQAAREERYASLRGYFHGMSDAAKRRTWSACIRSRCRQRQLRGTLWAHRRRTQRRCRGSIRRGKTGGSCAGTALQAGDVVVLRGTASAVHKAEQKLLR